MHDNARARDREPSDAGHTVVVRHCDEDSITVIAPRHGTFRARTVASRTSPARLHRYDDGASAAPINGTMNSDACSVDAVSAIGRRPPG